MKLTDTGLQKREQWEKAGYTLPSFDRASMISESEKNPTWVHFGAGNIFRVFPAALQQRLLNEGLATSGIIVGEGFDYEIIDEVFATHDNLTLMVTLNSDGSIDKEVIASIAGAYKCDPQFKEEWTLFKELFRKPSLEMASMTITEKGYSLTAGDGSFHPAVAADLEAGPDKSSVFIAKLTALVYERYLAKVGPLALVSMDNCSHNGEKLAEAVMTIGREWQKRGFVDSGFLTYLTTSVSYPWSMIDKITPRPDEAVRRMLEADGFEDTALIVTKRHTYTAAFVNAEAPQYLVIEDSFANGRPPLERAGVYFTDRDTVNKVERMKVTTCLNPLHTALAIFGCLLGHTLISDEMKDDELRRLVERIGYDEGMAVVVDPKILDPKAFIEEVLTVRFPNPFMPDTPQRIATDTSQKLAIRFGETIKAYLANEKLSVANLEMIPLVYAGYLRYLMAIDDNGEIFTPSPDPRLSELQRAVSGIKIGDTGPFDQLETILRDDTLWGVDLVETGMAERVIAYFTEMIASTQAVRNTLKEHVH